MIYQNILVIQYLLFNTTLYLELQNKRKEIDKLENMQFLNIVKRKEMNKKWDTYFSK